MKILKSIELLEIVNKGVISANYLGNRKIEYKNTKYSLPLLFSNLLRECSNYAEVEKKQQVFDLILKKKEAFKPKGIKKIALKVHDFFRGRCFKKKVKSLENKLEWLKAKTKKTKIISQKPLDIKVLPEKKQVTKTDICNLLKNTGPFSEIFATLFDIIPQKAFEGAIFVKNGNEVKISFEKKVYVVIDVEKSLDSVNYFLRKLISGAFENSVKTKKGEEIPGIILCFDKNIDIVLQNNNQVSLSGISVKYNLTDFAKKIILFNNEDDSFLHLKKIEIKNKKMTLFSTDKKTKPADIKSRLGSLKSLSSDNIFLIEEDQIL